MMLLTSYQPYEKRILPTYVDVSTIVWLHHLTSNETSGEKIKFELHMDAAFCFKQL